MSGKDHKETLAYKKERESFLNELQRFHHNRRTPYQVNPSIRGRDVDLYLLYTKVTAAGGWEKVNEEGRWEEFSSLFNLPEGCTHSDQALKRIYIRYLDIYERIHHRGEDPDKQDEYGNQEDGSGGMGGGLTPGARHKRKNPLGGVALKYNYQQHKVPPHLRHNYGLSTELICPSAYAKLEQALLSGLPNEVDFAFNVCTLLSNEGKHTLQLDQCPLILNYMLAHVAICNPDDGLFKLHEDGWKPMTKRNFLRFWYETVEDTEMRNLILPDSLEPKPGEKASTSLASRFYPPLASDSDVEFPGVLNLGRDLGLRDKEGQRVVQLAIILRNLSFEKGNMFVLSNTNVVFRFLLLCMHSNYSNLRQLALDTLSNMALQMVLEPLTKIKTRLILREIGRVIASPDKYEVIGGLDLLARLCQVEENEELLSDGLEQDIYSNIVTYLTVHDIQLIVYTLECLYQLSELGEAAGTHIASAQRAVDTLVSLVTIEAQSYGPESLRGIKVVEHVSVDAAGQPTAPPAPAAPATPARLEERPQAPSPAPQQRPQPVPAGVAPIPTAVAAARAPPATPERTPQGADSDSQCVSWLEAHYEVIDGYMLPRMDLYTDYINACSKSGTMKAVANAVSFANCVRMAFPTLELVKVGKSDGATDFHYRGLRRRPVPRPFGSQVGSRPMNTATPSPPPTQRAITPRQTNTPATATAGESTLIKSLLANKLQQNMQKMQTMSPQQQQSLTTQQPAPQQKPSILQQQLQQPPTPQHQLYQQSQQLPQQPVVSQNQMLQQQPIAQPPPQFVQQPMMQQPKQIVQQTIAPQPQQVVQQTAVQQPQQIVQQTIVQNPQQPIVQQTIVQNPQQPIVQQTTVQQPQQAMVQPANAPEAGQGMVEQSSSSTPTSSAQQGSDAAGSSSKQPTPPTETSDPPPSSLPASHSTSTTAIAQTNGPTTIANGVSSPGSSQPPTPLSLNPEEEEMDIKEYEDSSDKPDDSIQDKKARIKKLMQDTNVIRDNCLNTNGLVCHDSNGGKVKENGQVAEDKQQVLENGCPSPASTPPVNGHNNGELSSSQPVITDTAPVTVNNNATPPTPEPTPELPSNNPCVQHPAAPSHSVANPPNGNAASNPGHPAPNPAGNPASNPTHNPAPNSVAPPMHNPVSNPVVQSAGVPTVNNPAGLPVGAANPGGNPAVPQGNPIVSQAPGGIPAFVQQQQPQQQQTFIQAPQQYPQVPQQQMPVQQQIAGEQIVIQQGGQQHVVQLGQPLAQQLAQQPQQQLQQQQRPMMANGQLMMQQQQQYVGQQQGMVQPPVAPPPQPQLPPQQILQVQVPPGQQVMQVRMPPSNGQPQILHVHVPQGPGQPPHIMQVSIPPAPNGQAQTVQVQVRPNIAQPPQPARAPLPPYPAHLQQQQQQQQIIQQQIPQQQLPQQQLPQQQLPQQLAQQQQLPTSSSSQSGSSVPCSVPQSTPPPSPGQQHPILQQHLQHQQQQQQATSALSPNSMQRPPTPTGGAGAKRKRPMPPAAAKIAKRTDSADSNQSGASSSTSMPSPALPTLTTLNYMCEWKDCQKPAFESQKECHKHVMCEHFDREQSAFRCMWDGCDGLVRGRWSFVQHLQDRHLCEQALKAAALRRQQQQQLQQQPVAASTGPLSLPPPPVYPNDAALQAIRRFAIKPPYQQFVEAKEGPVTKHIRLTSALILRNLARYSSTGRSLIKQHEQHLAYVAFSAVEASNALSHCLSELQKH